MNCLVDIGVMMRVFDNATQELKYKVIKEVCKLAFEERLNDC